MPRECRNFNNIGKVSCLLVLLLAFLAVNPVSGSVVFAEEDAIGDYEASLGDASASRGFDEASNIDDADEVATLDAAGESTVGISFSPATYYADLAPTNAAGQLARIDFSATVSVRASNGYTVYLKSTSPNLTGVGNSSNVIPSTTSAKTYANMDVNTWGYASSVGSAIADTATYKAVGVSGNGDKLAENTSGGIITDSKTINLSFATKINNAKPADTYSNTMTFSVVSSPLEIADYWGISDMQQMTSTICANAKDTSGDGNISTQLRDTRDGKYYWVGKLADGKCWMTQNLDLDLNASTTPLTPATSDVSADWVPKNGETILYTADTVSSSTILANNTGQRSWSLGNYRIANPTASSNCGSKKASAADCSSQFTAYTTPTSANGDANAHYILGNHYQWNATTAGTGGTIVNNDTSTVQADSSICPKGWRLPTGGKDTDGNNIGEFQALITAGDINSDIVKLTSSPYYFVRGGEVYQSADSLFAAAGNYGYYSSSTPGSSNNDFYLLSLGGNSSVIPSNRGTGNRQAGFSVRCLAR